MSLTSQGAPQRARGATRVQGIMLLWWRSEGWNNFWKWLQMKKTARISIKWILLYIYKTTRVQKSVHRHFFSLFSFFFVGRSICKFISHNCSKRSLRWEQRGREQRGAGGLTITLLYNLSFCNVFLHRHWKTKTGKHSCGLHARRDLHSFWLFLTLFPLNQQTHFVLHIVCCFAITTTECNSSLCFFPKKKCTFWQKLGTFKKTWAFYNNTYFTCYFWSPHKYNICLFSCIQSPQKNSTDTGIYKSG